MYSNIGGKIKGLAKWVAIIGMISGAILLVVSLVAYTKNANYIEFANAYYAYDYTSFYERGMEAFAAREGILWSIVTIIVSFISSWPMYGFGQLIENTDKLVAAMNQQNKPKEEPSIEDELPSI